VFLRNEKSPLLNTSTRTTQLRNVLIIRGVSALVIFVYYEFREEPRVWIIHIDYQLFSPTKLIRKQRNSRQWSPAYRLFILIGGNNHRFRFSRRDIREILFRIIIPPDIFPPAFRSNASCFIYDSLLSPRGAVSPPRSEISPARWIYSAITNHSPFTVMQRCNRHLFRSVSVNKRGGY